MADSTGSEQLEKKVVETPEPDPIVDRSLSTPLLVSSLLLIATLLWSLYDEVLGQRPWKGYQREFVDRYTTYLDKIQPDRVKDEKRVKESEEYKQLAKAHEDAQKKAKSRVGEIDAQTRLIDQKVSDITEPFQNARAWIAAKSFEFETAGSESGKNRLREEIRKKKDEKIEVSVHNDNGSVEEKELTYNELESLYNSLRDEKARLVAERIVTTKPETEAKKKLDEYLQDNLTGLTPQQVGLLKTKMEKFDFSIKQVNIAGGAVVDRCESCHLGVREPVKLTKTNIGGEDKDMTFVSHPSKDLLKIHDPEQFGCSTCHGGNGRATVSMERAHGRYKHWLWPLYYKENVQAGCNSCHNRDRITPMADVLNHGKDLFQNRGCVGCHRYEGFDREGDALGNARQTIKQIELDRQERRREIKETEVAADEAPTDEEAARLRQRVDSLRQMIGQLEAQRDQLELESKYLMKDQKKVGPNLKEIKAKLRKEWIPVWLTDPQAFRPGTKMPTFRLEDDEVKAISAFLWQSALDVKVASQPPGDANRGKELFKTLGCLACHSIDGNAIDMGNQTMGGDFAANLSRVGEKANYDYIVRWVHNPRRRLAPYSPSEKRDLTEEDYRKKGLRFIFDDEHSKSPIDGSELQVQNMTVMPNFRLSDQDARDIATFLMTRKRREPQYPDASYLDDSSLKAKGEQLVKSYGCAGCHEIRGLEEEQRIGTELTQEGSKPIERLDFALLTEDAKKGIDPMSGHDDSRKWYDHKGFFENKLRSPGVYDRGKEKPPEERLKMPNIYLEENDIHALTTFLLGSVTPSLPASLRYMPEGPKKEVQDGWWVVQKYNCMGCHNVLIGQDSVLMGLPMYQGSDGKEQQPPRLTSEGARVNPDWLLRFLKDPSLGRDQMAQDALTRRAGSGAGGQGSGNSSLIRSRLTEHLMGGVNQQAAQSQTTAPGTQPATQATSPNLLLGEQPGQNRNGVRQYLKARMPTFNFSPNELQALVNFFMGASSQQQPYIPERLEPLTADEQNFARVLFTKNSDCLKCHMTGNPAHDVRATAPNFLLAAERLKPAWTRRWIVGPQLISPGTSMPDELFEYKQAESRWVMKGAIPPEYQSYDRDHADLLVRYMFQITADEQSRLAAGSSTGASAPAAATPAGANNKTSALIDKGPRRSGGLAASRAP